MCFWVSLSANFYINVLWGVYRYFLSQIGVFAFFEIFSTSFGNTRPHFSLVAVCCDPDNVQIVLLVAGDLISNPLLFVGW